LCPDSQDRKGRCIGRRYKCEKYFRASSPLSLFPNARNSLSQTLPLICCGLPDVSLSRNYTSKGAQATAEKTRNTGINSSKRETKQTQEFYTACSLPTCAGFQEQKYGSRTAIWM